MADRRLRAMSGGELQRLVLARALAQEAPVLLLDEPTSALDLGRRMDALELIDEVRRERGLTVLSAIHDLTLAGQFADRLMLLADGRIAADGPAATVLDGSLLAGHFGAGIQVITTDAGELAVISRRLGRQRELQDDQVDRGRSRTANPPSASSSSRLPPTVSTNAPRISAAASITPWRPTAAASSSRGWPPRSRQAIRTSAEPRHAATAMPSSCGAGPQHPAAVADEVQAGRPVQQPGGQTGRGEREPGQPLAEQESVHVPDWLARGRGPAVVRRQIDAGRGCTVPARANQARAGGRPGWP